jgi:hypothetical protein
LPPSSGVINPYPFAVLKNFTVPFMAVGLWFAMEVSYARPQRRSTTAATGTK